MEYTAVVFAYHDVGVRCLSVMLSHGVRIPLVVTHRDDPSENVWFESVEKLARANDLEVAIPENPTSPQFLQKLTEISPGRFCGARALAPSTCTARCCRSSAAAPR